MPPTAVTDDAGAPCTYAVGTELGAGRHHRLLGRSGTGSNDALPTVTTLTRTWPGGDPDHGPETSRGWLPMTFPPVPPRPRTEVPPPHGPDDPFRNLHRCARKLEDGDWRETLVLLGGDGTSMHRLAVVTKLLALSMFRQTVGDVERAWTMLQEAATVLPPTLTRTDPDTGHVSVALQTSPILTREPNRDEFRFECSARQEAHLTVALARVTWREQTELSQLRLRPHLYPSARDALVRAGQEFLVWVEFAPETWRRALPPDRLHNAGIALPRSLHQPSRKNLCNRASKLRRFADPAQGDVSDSVWADAGGYPGVKALALEHMSTMNGSTWRLGPSRSAAAESFPVRTGCAAAWRFAQEC